MRCHVCSRTVILDEAIICTKCKHVYHYQCMNAPTRGLERHSEEQRVHWRCSPCKKLTYKRTKSYTVPDDSRPRPQIQIKPEDLNSVNHLEAKLELIMSRRFDKFKKIIDDDIIIGFQGLRNDLATQTDEEYVVALYEPVNRLHIRPHDEISAEALKERIPGEGDAIEVEINSKVALDMAMTIADNFGFNLTKDDVIKAGWIEIEKPKLKEQNVIHVDPFKKARKLSALEKELSKPKKKRVKPKPKHDDILGLPRKVDNDTAQSLPRKVACCVLGRIFRSSSCTVLDHSPPTNRPYTIHGEKNVEETTPHATLSWSLVLSGECRIYDMEDDGPEAGCGLSQIRVLLATSLALMGSALELTAIPFILPSAEIELCILKHEKNWLVLISLVGCALGSANWGLLADRLGRKRCLLSCLAVNAIFAAVAAFMPTYGTFMMARFCSALGSSGLAVSSVSWTRESALWWRRGLALLIAAAALGAAGGAWLAQAALPPTGALALPLQPGHFTPWHRYLLICTLPLLASLVSLIWTQESPRYLLEVGREVDAMMVYQNMHMSNQIQLCGEKKLTSGDKYKLSELALPGKRGPRTQMSFLKATAQLFSSAYRMKTLALGGIIVFSMALQFFLSAYIPATVDRTKNEIFEASRQSVQNTTIQNELYNNTLENIIYSNVTFQNCTFQNILLSHVAFNNCTFDNVAFSNIKTSYTEIKGGMFYNSTIIDTDMEYGLEIDEYSTLNSTIIRGMRGACSSHVDLTSRLHGLVVENLGSAGFVAAAAVIAFLFHRIRFTVLICLVMLLLCPSLYLCETEMALYGVEWVYRLLSTLAIYYGTVGLMEAYPANLRCTGHGIALSFGFALAAIMRGLPPLPPFGAAVTAGLLALGALCAAVAD